jgi:hypothetical protein
MNPSHPIDQVSKLQSSICMAENGHYYFGVTEAFFTHVELNSADPARNLFLCFCFKPMAKRANYRELPWNLLGLYHCKISLKLLFHSYFRLWSLF